MRIGFREGGREEDFRTDFTSGPTSPDGPCNPHPLALLSEAFPPPPLQLLGPLPLYHKSSQSFGPPTLRILDLFLDNR